MKRITLLLVFCLISAVHMGEAQEAATPAPKPAPKFSAEFMTEFRQAAAAYYQRSYKDALDLVEEAEKIQPGTALVANFKGAVYLDLRDFDKATKCFEEALKIEPAFWPPRYNLIEVPFRQKKYREARAKYETMLAREPKNELIQYRIFLTYVLEKNVTAAEEAMNKIPAMGDTPAYYYAHAVWALINKKPEEATEMFKGAAFVFPAQKRVSFAEPLEVLGWIQPRVRRGPPAAPGTAPILGKEEAPAPEPAAEGEDKPVEE